MIKNFLKALQLNESSKKYGILLASFMFIWSGINKIRLFERKVEILMKKTGFPKIISSLGMIGVIILEIIGFIILIDYFFNFNKVSKLFNNYLTSRELVQLVLLMILLFLIVVTPLYHPFDLKHPIPFLSNVTTFGLFLYVYCDF